MGRTDLGVGDFTRAIELKPNLADAYCNRAACYLALGAQDKARADLAGFQRLGGKVDPSVLKALEQAPGP
jgi:tetratricopeptide (TPR) repeat protein